MSPNVTPGLRHRAALPRAARRRPRGRRLRGRDVQHRRPAGQRRLAEPGRAPADQVPDLPRRALALRRRQLLLGRRLRPAGRRRTPTRAASPRRRRRPARQEMAPWAHKVMLELREYANNGGKLLVDGRNVHQPFTANSASLSATGPYTWTPDKLFGFFYPPNNEGDDDLPGTAWQRSREISNDTWQNYLGVVGRQSGVGVDAATTTNSDQPEHHRAAPGRAEGRRPVRRHGAVHDRRRADGRPEPGRRRHAAAAGRASRCACATGARPTSRCARSASRPTTPPRSPTPTTGGAIISTRDAVTFGFGLEQVDRGHAQRARQARR